MQSRNILDDNDGYIFQNATKIPSLDSLFSSVPHSIFSISHAAEMQFFCRRHIAIAHNKAGEKRREKYVANFVNIRIALRDRGGLSFEAKKMI